MDPERPTAYDPLFASSAPPAGDEGDLERARREFRAASRPFLRTALSWLGWAVVLPAASLATPTAFRLGAESGVLLLWSVAVLAGGALELGALTRSRAVGAASPLASWALRVQGNVSVVAVLLSAALVWGEAANLLPSLWLLLLGHSLYLLGGLAFAPMRTAGLIYQLGGAVALWPGGPALVALAAATGAGNLWMAWSIWSRGTDDDD
jgi:hypothetical protein